MHPAFREGFEKSAAGPRMPKPFQGTQLTRQMRTGISATNKAAKPVSSSVGGSVGRSTAGGSPSVKS